VDELLIVRHAIAEDRDPARFADDSARPLSAAGAERFARAARGLGRLAPGVELVLSSPYARAWQTAEILEHEAGWPAPERCAALEAICSAGDALGALAGRPERSVAVVGHEPQLSELASLLLAGDESAARLELKKGGVALLACPGGPRPGTAVLRWSATPKLLRAAG
jgi:phosphohistidine phosphatase